MLPEQIIIGAGTEYLYGLLIQLLGTDKIYAVENPGYRKIPQIYRSWQVACEYIDMDERGRTESGELEAQAGGYSPYLPVPPLSDRDRDAGQQDAMSCSAGQRKVNSHYIIEDDYDSELRLERAADSDDAEHRCLRPRHLHEYIYQDAGIDGPHQLHDSTALRFWSEFYERLSFYSCSCIQF